MKKIIAEIIIPIITILFTFALQYISNLLREPNGVYEVSINSVNSELIGTILLENKSNDTQENLIFLIDGIKDINVESSSYLDYKIEKSKTDSTICLLTITKQLAKIKNKIIITGLNRDSKISFSNSEEIKYVSSEVLINRQLNSLRNAIITTIIYCVIFLLVYFYSMNRLNKNSESNKNEREQLMKEVEKLKEEEDLIKKGHIKFQLLQMAKLRDYEKELNFWKTNISKILYEDTSINPNKLFNRVTKELKTYGTKDITSEELTMAEYIEKITKNN